MNELSAEESLISFKECLQTTTSNRWINTSAGHINFESLTHTKVIKLEDNTLGIFLFAGNRQMGAFGGEEGAKLIRLFDYICLFDVTEGRRA